MNNRKPLLIALINEFPEQTPSKHILKYLTTELNKYKSQITNSQERALSNYLNLINNSPNNTNTTIKLINKYKPLMIKIVKTYDVHDNYAYDSNNEEDTEEDTESTTEEKPNIYKKLIKICQIKTHQIDFAVYLTHDGIEIQIINLKTNRIYRNKLTELKLFRFDILLKTIHDPNEIYIILNQLTLFPEKIIENTFTKNTAELCCVVDGYDFDLEFKLIP
jgi:hypothetical protein